MARIAFFQKCKKKEFPPHQKVGSIHFNAGDAFEIYQVFSQQKNLFRSNNIPIGIWLMRWYLS